MKRILLILVFSLSFVFSFSCFSQVIIYDSPYNRIAFDEDNVWIAATKGVVKYNKDKRTVEPCQSDYFTNVPLSSLFLDEQGRLWTSGKGPGVRTPGYVFSTGDYDPLYDGYVFAADGNGSVFVPVYTFLLEFDKDGNFMDFKYHGFQTPGYMSATDMKIDSNGVKWMTYSCDRYAFDPILVKGGDAVVSKTADTGNATSLTLDRNGKVWMTCENGIVSYDDVSGETVLYNNQSDSSIPEEVFFKCVMDDNDILWAISGETLLRYDGISFTAIKDERFNNLVSIVSDGSILWIYRNDCSLIKYDGGEPEVIRLDEENRLMSIYDFVSEDCVFKTESFDIEMPETEICGCLSPFDDMFEIPSEVEYNGLSFTVTAVGMNGFSDDYNVGGLKSIILPENLTVIKNGAFRSCDSLETVCFGGNLEVIGDNAFASCPSISYLEFPGSFSFIGSGAFSGCSGLQKIKLNSTIPPEFDSYPFDDDIYDSCVLLVPDLSLEKYRNHKLWGRFRNLETYDTSSVQYAYGSDVSVNVIGNGRLEVSNMKPGDVVCVYDINGTKLEEKHVAGCSVTFELDDERLYIIQCGSITLKVLL